MEEYEAIENYTAEDKSQLSLKIFDVVAVITKNASGVVVYSACTLISTPLYHGG